MTTMTTRPGSVPYSFVLIGLLLTTAVATTSALTQTKRDVSVVAVKYRFRVGNTDQPVIAVNQNDLVRVTLTSEDIPHSFTLPDYRISKRVEPGREVTFEFRAEQTGRFEFFCSMTSDQCRERGMVGTLVVNPPGAR
jgi:heme/copper-type cytochrome/quinol oxidase subunit 2